MEDGWLKTIIVDYKLVNSFPLYFYCHKLEDSEHGPLAKDTKGLEFKTTWTQAWNFTEAMASFALKSFP